MNLSSVPPPPDKLVLVAQISQWDLYNGQNQKFSELRQKVCSSIHNLVLQRVLPRMANSNNLSQSAASIRVELMIKSLITILTTPISLPLWCLMRREKAEFDNNILSKFESPYSRLSLGCLPCRASDAPTILNSSQPKRRATRTARKMLRGANTHAAIIRPWNTQKTLSQLLTLILVVAIIWPLYNNAKIHEKWLKPWHNGTHLRVLSESYLMNTNMTGFRWFSNNIASLCYEKKWPQPWKR